MVLARLAALVFGLVVRGCSLPLGRCERFCSLVPLGAFFCLFGPCSCRPLPPGADVFVRTFWGHPGERSVPRTSPVWPSWCLVAVVFVFALALVAGASFSCPSPPCRRGFFSHFCLNSLAIARDSSLNCRSPHMSAAGLPLCWWRGIPVGMPAC